MEPGIVAVIAICCSIVASLITGVCFYFIPKANRAKAQKKAEDIISDANIKAEKLIANAKFEAKNDAEELKKKAEREIQDRKQEVAKTENKL